MKHPLNVLSVASHRLSQSLLQLVVALVLALPANAQHIHYEREVAFDTDILADDTCDGLRCGYGALSNPTGQPIGGGEEYGDWIPFYYKREGIRDARTLVFELENARKGDVIYVADDAEIDLTSLWENRNWEPIVVNAGVTLASGRGRDGSLGGLIEISRHPDVDQAVLLQLGSGTRVTGVRVFGPQTAIDLPDCGRKDAIAMAVYGTSTTDVVIDNNEMWGWPGAAVYVHRARDVLVKHNHIHHNRHKERSKGCEHYGVGYGVTIHHKGSAIIEANLFDHNRHDIASDGRIGASYIARYNLVLTGAVEHSFDVHGGADRGDGTDIAGTEFLVHNNTFLQDHKPAFRIRGVPLSQAKVVQNEFMHRVESEAANQVNAFGNFTVSNNLTGVRHWPAWFASFGAKSFWTFRSFDSTAREDVAVGDFDCDGRDDLFRSTGTQWEFSRSAREPWKLLATSGVPLSGLALGDFDGNGCTDVFRADGRYWRVSWNGNSKWQILNRSGIRKPSLVFGDFNGDGKTDVARSSNGKWWVSWSGQSRWTQLNSSYVDLRDTILGDWDGNGTTDVLRISSGYWRVSWSGSSKWDYLGRYGNKPSAVVGNFDNSPGDDLLMSKDGRWLLGSGDNLSNSKFLRWVNWNVSSHSTAGLLVGDWNGDGIADVLSQQGN